MKDKELKPCPFCGETNLKIKTKCTSIISNKSLPIEHCLISIHCMKCEARSPVIEIYMPYNKYYKRTPPIEKAAEAWNNRIGT